MKADSSPSRFPWLLGVAASLCRQFPDRVVIILLTGPFTLASHLLGLENLLCECLLNPAATRLSLEHLSTILLEFIRRAAAAGFEVTLFESSASPPMLSLKLFDSLLKPVLEQLMAEAGQCLDERPALIMGGDTLPVLEGILELRPSYIICPIETDQKQFVARCIEARPDLHLRVNMQPQVFTQDSPDGLLREAARAARLAERYPQASIGTILPLETRPEMVDLAAGCFEIF